MKKRNRRHNIRLPWKEQAWIYGKAAAIVGSLAYLFYRSLLIFGLMLPLSVYLAGRMKKQARERKERGLAVRFKDGLLALGASLSAGHSAENAVRDAAEELAFLYGREDVMTKEFERIAARTEMNVPLEQAMAEFSARTGLADIRSFTEVFRAARRTGGEMGKIILDTVHVITGKLEVREEIYTMLRGRQYEQKIMKAIPLLILFYLDRSSPGFFSVLYETMLGRIIMTVCLAVYLTAVYLADKISDIPV